jgi:hypothetical protein
MMSLSVKPKYVPVILISVTILLHYCPTSICQDQYGAERVIQFSNGENNITFYIVDYETDEPLIGAEINSINRNETLAKTDIYGIATIEKGLEGNLEVSYVGYDFICFKLNDKSIDSIVVRLKLDINIGCGFLDTFNYDSLFQAAKNNAQFDLNNDEFTLYTLIVPSEEQQLFAQNHSFMFEIWEGKNLSYKESYNKIILDYLSKKFDKNIEEELRKICWRNHQLLIK